MSFLLVFLPHGGGENVFPALSARPRSRWSSWQRIATLRRWGHLNRLTGAIMELSLILSQAVSLQGVSEAPSLTRTHWTVRLGRRPPCLRITRWRTSCGQPDPAAGVALWVVAGCFRHCRRDHAHGGAAGRAYAYFWRLWIRNRNFQLLGSCVIDIGRWFLSQNITNWRQPVAHAQPVRCIRRCRQSAALLRPFVHHADGLIRQLARSAGP